MFKSVRRRRSRVFVLIGALVLTFGATTAGANDDGLST